MSPLAFRAVTLSLVAAFLVASHLAVREPAARAEAQYRFVIALGYGHLIGAALGAGRPRVRAPLDLAFAAVTLATAFGLYLEGMAAWPGLAFALLALSVWHFTENDAALAGALATGGPLRPLPRGARAHARPLAAAAVLVAAALAVSPDPGLLGDLFAAATLFHLLGWLVFLLARGASRTRLLALHLPPLALCAWLFSSPGGSLALLRELASSPAIYLFWASLHVAHTARARGIARA